MSFAVGSLVRARGREWVVLPESDDRTSGASPARRDRRRGHRDLLAAGAGRAGAVRSAGSRPSSAISLRAACSATPCGWASAPAPGRFARSPSLAVEPRPYQLVPLLMALKLDPVRLLIADDVGIGKTVEAALIARELLDRGEVARLAVLCPPHLAEQWQAEAARQV